MRRWAPKLAIGICSGTLLSACASTPVIRPATVESLRHRELVDLNGIPWRSASASELDQQLRKLQRSGVLGSYLLRNNYLLVRGLTDGDFTQLEVLYAPDFSRIDAVFGVPRDAITGQRVLTGSWLSQRPERFIGLFGNGFLYATDRANEVALLSVSPGDSVQPQLLRLGWIFASISEIERPFGIATPASVMQAIEQRLRRGDLSEGRELTTLYAPLFSQLDEKQARQFAAMEEQLRARTPQPVDETAALLNGTVFDRLQAYRDRTKEPPFEVVDKLLESLNEEAEGAETQGRLATAAYLHDVREHFGVVGAADQAAALKATLARQCWPEVLLSGALQPEHAKLLRAPFDATSDGLHSSVLQIEISAATPIFELAPQYRRETRTATYRGEVKRTERLTAEAMQEISTLQLRIREIESLLATAKMPEEELKRREKEKQELEAKRGQLLEKHSPKREFGEVEHRYTAIVQTWSGTVELTATLTHEGRSETIRLTFPFKSHERARIAPSPERGVKGADEWLDESAAKLEAGEAGRRELVNRIRVQLQDRAAECSRATASRALGTERDRRREQAMRAFFFGAARDEDLPLLGPTTSSLRHHSSTMQ